ncbi:hypothetical protein D5S18_02970 [Nocardia panacis]|uniref:Tape measure protein N-terminal domain-containing protein n=1 Tax=Nocardia panacis TaxID=2340916 RepID=A0A3A4KF02_9NOCA|nr:hypothetical protein D5S18_02970 [Nocardia panacis]
MSIVADTSKIPGQVKAALGLAETHATRAGNSMGKSMGSSIGSGVSGGLQSAASDWVRGGFLGDIGSRAGHLISKGFNQVFDSAVKGGFERLNIKQQAEAQLHALGKSSIEIKKLIGEADQIVKGTALTLPEMLQSAAMASAAGVRSGDKMSTWLRALGDAAVYTHQPLSRVTQIMDKVVSQGRAYGTEIRQLGILGLPVRKWLEEYSGLSGKALMKWQKDGNISADVLAAIIEKKIGGAAKTMGGTVKTTFGNLRNAIARVGEAAEAPVFSRMTGWFTDWSKRVDLVTPKVAVLAKRLDDLAVNEWGPRALGVFRQLHDGAGLFGGKIGDTFTVLRDTVTQLAPGVRQLAEASLKAGAAVGAGAWNVLLGTLQTLTPLLGGVVRLLTWFEQHTGAVTGFVTAWLGLRAVSSVIAGLVRPMANIAESTRALARSGGLSGAGAVLGGRATGIVLGVTGLGKVNAELARLQGAGARGADAATAAATALGRTGTAAETAGRKVRGVTAGIGAVAGGFRGLLGAVGGPWGAALTTATVLGAGSLEGATQARYNAERIRDAAVDATKAEAELGAAIQRANGAFDEQAKSAAGRMASGRLAEVTTWGKDGHAWYANVGHWIDNATGNVFGRNDEWERGYNRVSSLGDQYRLLTSTLAKSGYSLDDLGSILSDTRSNALIERITADRGTAGEGLAETLTRARDEIQRAADVARTSTPGVYALRDAMRSLADETGTAGRRAQAMHNALSAMNGGYRDAADAARAQLAVVEQMRAEPWAASDGRGAALLSADQQRVDLGPDALPNAGLLHDELKRVTDAAIDAAAKGERLPEVFERANRAFDVLAEKSGLSADKLRDVAATVGYLPADIELMVRMRGADDVTQRIGTILQMLHAHDGQATVGLDFLTDDARNSLAGLGVDIQLAADKNKWVLRADMGDIETAIRDFKPEPVTVPLAPGYPDWMKYYLSSPPSPQAPPHPRAGGGPIFGLGGPTSDSIPALLSAGEHVWTAAEVAAVGGQDAMYGLRARARAGGLRFARGGTPTGIQEAIKAAREAEGMKYVLGGDTLLTGFDCSGFIGWLQQIAEGLGRNTHRIYTTYTLLDNPDRFGLKPGVGPAGTYFVIGAGPEHMAATIAGQNVEAGGKLGTSGIGGARAGAFDAQFPFRFYLPNALVAGYNSRMSGGRVIEWTEDDKLQLSQLETDLQQAREKRQKLDRARSKATDADKRDADLKIESIQRKIRKKEWQRDHVGDVEDGSRIPMDLPLPDHEYTDRETRQLALDKAVQDARDKYEQASDDYGPDDVETKLAAAELQRALKNQARGTSSDGSADRPTTLKGVLQKAGSDLVGVAFDAIKEQLSPEIGQSRWWSVADQGIAIARDWDKSKEEGGSGGADAIANVRAALAAINPPARDQVDKQLGYNPAAGVPEWAREVRRRTAVYDSGGWLEPGQMAVNLSNRPEPIFNSPAQVRAFAGNLTVPRGAGVSLEDLHAVLANRPNVTFQVTDIDSAMAAWRAEQRRQALSFSRR